MWFIKLTWSCLLPQSRLPETIPIRVFRWLIPSWYSGPPESPLHVPVVWLLSGLKMPCVHIMPYSRPRGMLLTSWRNLSFEVRFVWKMSLHIWLEITVTFAPRSSPFVPDSVCPKPWTVAIFSSFCRPWSIQVGVSPNLSTKQCYGQCRYPDNIFKKCGM